MPTLEHHGLVDMFRGKPPLAAHLVEMLFGLPVPEHSKVKVGEGTLDQLAPVELRADLILELRDDEDEMVLSIILEAQRGEDQIKKYSWVSYLAGERSRKKCPVVLLVVTADPKVEAWAAEKIDLGLGLSHVQPLVLGPAAVPEVLDVELAQQEPELAVLSAMVHGEGPNALLVAQMGLVGAACLDQGRPPMYFRILLETLREPLRRALEKMSMEQHMDGDAEWTFPPYLQRFIDRGLREGREEGERKAKRETLLHLLSRAGIALTEEEQGRVTSCDDPAMLERWIGNVLGAKTAADVFG